jgi:hypothetical protein
MRLTKRATDGRYIPRFLTESCLAHKRLDEAVFAAYGWNSDLSDEEILEKLLALNLQRSRGESSG